MQDIGIFHQCGHNEKWNLDSYITDRIGDGVILSPVNMKKEKIVALNDNIKMSSFFDPQFYLPRSTHKNLNAYDFFPNTIANGYSTIDFETLSHLSAKKCIQFQLDNKFKFIIIPCIYFEDLTPNYFDIQRELYINPFLEELRMANNTTPVLLSVIVKDIQLKDEQFKNDLLNFVTSYIEIDGIYLIPEHKETYKRVRDMDYLFSLMVFIDILRSNSLYVHVGYVDIEGYLLTLADVNSISIGAYENVRGFSTKKFAEQISQQRQGPVPRIYSSKLFQWIDHRYLGALKQLYSGYDNLFFNTAYKVEMFKPEFQWHFTKPDIYKHYFISYSNQIKSLPKEYNDRYNIISTNLQTAKQEYTNIRNSGINFDDNTSGEHIDMWLTAINMYKKYKERG